MKSDQIKSFSDFMTVKEAAEFLGIAAETLRRWDKKGKLKAYRHPMNRYRLYKKQDLENLLKQVKQPKGGEKKK